MLCSFNIHLTTFLIAIVQFKQHFQVPYSRFKDDASASCTQNLEGIKRKRDDYEENLLLLQKEKDARNDG
jgi:hypothetical protein